MAEKNPAVKAPAVKAEEKPPRCVGVKKGMAPKKFLIIWASFLIVLSLGLIVMAGAHHLGGSGEEDSGSPSAKPPEIRQGQTGNPVRVVKVNLIAGQWTEWNEVDIPGHAWDLAWVLPEGTKMTVEFKDGHVREVAWNQNIDFGLRAPKMRFWPNRFGKAEIRFY